jgi:hypothetical protein
MERDEVAHLAADGWDADLESTLATAVAVAHADHDGATSAHNPPDPVSCAEVVDVKVEGLRSHRASVLSAVAVTGGLDT